MTIILKNMLMNMWELSNKSARMCNGYNRVVSTVPDVYVRHDLLWFKAPGICI